MFVVTAICLLPGVVWLYSAPVVIMTPFGFMEQGEEDRHGVGGSSS